MLCFERTESVKGTASILQRSLILSLIESTNVGDMFRTQLRAPADEPRSLTSLASLFHCSPVQVPETHDTNAMTSPTWQNQVVPARLAFLAIYNPALGPSDETFHHQLVFYYNRAAHDARVASRKSSRNDAAGGDAIRALENEKLRQIGLAQGMVCYWSAPYIEQWLRPQCSLGDMHCTRRFTALLAP